MFGIEGSPSYGRSQSASEENMEESGPIERGTDATITPLFHPNRLTDEQCMYPFFSLFLSDSNNNKLAI